MSRHSFLILAGMVGLLSTTVAPLNAQDAPTQDDPFAARIRTTMRRAAGYYFESVSSHGGYVYYYSADLSRRLGEGTATADQIWVQPPGTPTVGMAYLAAWQATGDEYYLRAATAAAEAIVAGQLQSGGWTNCIDFHPQGDRVAMYRNRPGRGRNTSSLDDGQTQSAIRFLVLTDEAWKFRHRAIHEAATVALEALLTHQYPNGAFPQVWEGELAPPKQSPDLRANYPVGDWRTEGRVKNYWDMYTLNDDVAGYLVKTLIEAHRVYGDPRYRDAVSRLGDFLRLAQMPEPQPGWAQQYNYDMQPIWARKFEPPGVTGDETQEVIETLLTIHEFTGDARFLEPIPRALAYLRRSLLPDGRLARYYELRTNRPLYMERQGENYTLTYDDSRLPSHYGWKGDSRIDSLQERYERLLRGERSEEPARPGEREVREIMDSLDEQGRWISSYEGEPLVGQAKFQRGEPYLSSERFSRHLEQLARYLTSGRPAGSAR